MPSIILRWHFFIPNLVLDRNMKKRGIKRMQTATKYTSDITLHQDSSELKRGLKSRHLTMISLGGTIGTGLFLASGGAIHSAGPGGAMLSYLVIGIMVFFLMQGL